MDINSRGEIGSEFWSVPVKDKENSIFPEKTEWFLSGRSALKSIVRDIKEKHGAKKAYLPSWCCDSMIIPFIEEEINVEFYPVYESGGKLKQDIASAGNQEILFLMDYFGYTVEREIIDTDGIVICDLTHSVLSGKQRNADYYFGSMRKWAGFYTGGFAIGTKTADLCCNEEYVKLRKVAMEEKERYIKGESCEKRYLGIFAEAEEYLEKCDVAGAYERDVKLAEKLDVSLVKEKRRKNAKILIEAFRDIAIFKKLSEEDCPLFVPITVKKEKRDALRKHLIENSMYCPVHWQITDVHTLDDRTRKIYDCELSLVCDQRYDEIDMERIIKAIREF